MEAKRNMAMAMTLAALLAGCESAPPQTSAAELTSLQAAADCSSTLPTFGRFLYPGKIRGTPNTSRPTGAWCCATTAAGA